jgi:tungstate transport system substrate-binding protein
MRVAASLVLLALTISGTAWPLHAQQRVLRVAVVNTPDVLLGDLIGVFEQGTGYRVTLTITEGVFDLARAGMADLVIAHYGHAGTEAFMSEGLGRWPRMVFANQAVLVGPSSDPVGIRGLADAAEAFLRISQRGGEFLVNNAPTERYLAEVLWRTAGSPPKSRWQIDLQLRDQAAIEMAAQRGAYTLWGLVPFLRLQEQRLQQQRPLGMDALVLRDPTFQRVMVSIVVNPARIRGVDEQGAVAFERFLLDPSTQARIRAFRHDGLTDQTWWPAGRNNAGAELSQF